jgi:hypothetical protein
MTARSQHPVPLSLPLHLPVRTHANSLRINAFVNICYVVYFEPAEKEIHL